MGLRFRKSVKIAPGVRINLNKRSTSVSFGGRRAGITVNSKRGTSYRISAPGTGISYTGKLSKKSNPNKSHYNRYDSSDEYFSDSSADEPAFSDCLDKLLDHERPIPETWFGVVLYCLRYGFLPILVFLYLLFYAQPVHLAIGYGLIRCSAVYSCIEVIDNQKLRTGIK